MTWKEVLCEVGAYLLLLLWVALFIGLCISGAAVNYGGDQVLAAFKFFFFALVGLAMFSCLLDGLKMHGLPRDFGVGAECLIVLCLSGAAFYHAASNLTYLI